MHGQVVDEGAIQAAVDEVEEALGGQTCHVLGGDMNRGDARCCHP